jgi:hypothetical protein
MSVDFMNAIWINEPREHEVHEDAITIVTDPRTDLWQRSYYGFRNDSAHMLIRETRENFTFTARASFEYRGRFDQCGLVIYQDDGCWFKASIEYENESLSRLGSVVTNHGYSDWATRDIETVSSIWYRLSRRGPDFLIASSFDGTDFAQMRVFHLHSLGETTREMGRLDPPAPTDYPVRVGVYACSPLESSFRALFSDLRIESCGWRAHR